MRDSFSDFMIWSISFNSNISVSPINNTEMIFKLKAWKLQSFIYLNALEIKEIFLKSFQYEISEL